MTKRADCDLRMRGLDDAPTPKRSRPTTKDNMASLLTACGLDTTDMVPNRSARPANLQPREQFLKSKFVEVEKWRKARAQLRKKNKQKSLPWQKYESNWEKQNKQKSLPWHSSLNICYRENPRRSPWKLRHRINKIVLKTVLQDTRCLGEPSWRAMKIKGILQDT